ncbi:MAG TPA: phage tail sheath subtilisin-like domain-containing protein [Blastocatellia bacterium]|nr:phage tail sheath subtilisin-like domain-containing protein [Blastocatellia bacterium]
MPEYLAPGVYVEEVSFRSKSIEGVSTTTTGFIGPARYGPLDLEPDIITSLGEFKRTYGDGQQLKFGTSGSLMHNYLWHAVRAFFEEGGKRLYVVRVFKPSVGDGRARKKVPASGGASLEIAARFPGESGNARARITVKLGQSILGGEPGSPTLGALRDKDVVLISDITSPIDSTPGSGTFYEASSTFDPATKQVVWSFKSSTGATLTLDHLTPNLNPALGDQVRVITLTVTYFPVDPAEPILVWDGLALDPAHERDGAKDSLTARFAGEPDSMAEARTLPIIVTAGAGVATGLDVLAALAAENTSLNGNLLDDRSTDDQRSVDVQLTGGNDGDRPSATEYEGAADPDSTRKTGLKAFEDIDDVSIIAAPGSTFNMRSAGYASQANSIVGLLISHASRMRYRIAVLDSGDGQSISEVRAMRGKIDSTYAALYYPWVRVLDPITRREIHLPPSGFMAGIYARNDINRAVYKAPANEVVNLAIGFEQLLNKAQQDVLNPEGVNCFRFFEGRGFRVWGARTVSSDPEWKYVNLRRYFAYLERSIDKGTQWAVFEPNGEALWANVRRTVEDFLLNEWMSGALLGDKPEKAFFVKCDRSTMTQNDLDNGRLICLIGVAPLRPAEFVIFRIGQWTADRKA